MEESPTTPFPLENVHNTPCFFNVKPDCPIKGFTWFWKSACICIVVLLVCCSLTIWMMALSLGRYSTEIREMKAAVAVSHDAMGVKIEGHKQLTLENRVVTSEIRGMLSSHIEDHKNLSQKERK